MPPNLEVRMSPCGRNSVYLFAVDAETGQPIEEARIVSKRDLPIQREKYASELFNRPEVRTVISAPIPAWAKNGGSNRPVIQ